jgi:hypothetical protein
VRADRVPFDGLYARDFWSIGNPVYDRFEVKLPPSLATGRYRVEVSIETRSLLPNFTLDDLLYNRDHYSGTACTTLDVRESVVRQR